MNGDEERGNLARGSLRFQRSRAAGRAAGHRGRGSKRHLHCGAINKQPRHCPVLAHVPHLP